MKAIYDKFVKRYPKAANPERERLCGLMQNEINGKSLFSVELAATSRNATIDLAHEFALTISYNAPYKKSRGPKLTLFDICLTYKGEESQRIMSVNTEKVFYRIDNLKAVIEYAINGNADIDYLLQLYKKLIDATEPYKAKEHTNSEEAQEARLVQEAAYQQLFASLAIQNPDFIDKGALKVIYDVYSVSYDQFVHRIIKALRQCFEFQALVREVNSAECQLRCAQNSYEMLMDRLSII